MKKIDWTKWSAIAEILSAIAIVVTLLYLAAQTNELSRQTQQNTRSLEINAYQDLVGQIGQVAAFALESPDELAEVLALLELSPGELSRSDNFRAQSFIMNLIRHGDMAYLQSEREVISEERMESAITILNNVLCTPYFQEFWPTVQTALVPSYGAFLEPRVSGC